MNDDKIKRSIITGAATWAVLLQLVPLAGAFNSQATAKEKPALPSVQPTDCIPESASAENAYVFGANC
jgi:hypothetical protein